MAPLASARLNGSPKMIFAQQNRNDALFARTIRSRLDTVAWALTSAVQTVAQSRSTDGWIQANEKQEREQPCLRELGERARPPAQQRTPATGVGAFLGDRSCGLCCGRDGRTPENSSRATNHESSHPGFGAARAIIAARAAGRTSRGDGCPRSDLESNGINDHRLDLHHRLCISPTLISCPKLSSGQANQV